eukprot:scaffold4614_cov247-Pinguiococcus_pyrenoidosus.AAC.8
MGPSGAGKSSLLNVLAGRIAPSGKARISGSVELDGEAIDPVANRALIAYVMQDDSTLLPTVTPREAFSFSAALRTPHVEAEERAELVETLLEELGLSHVGDTFVGGPLVTGLSGGQRKRTSIGVELITRPEMIFLDEPTSGLDSFSAKNVVALLSEVANSGATIACTIHQPSSQVFGNFDILILLRKGRVVYEGPREGIEAYLTDAGHPVPELHNPADFMFSVMAQLGDEGMKKKDLYMAPPADLAGKKSAKGRKLPQTLDKGSALVRFVRESKLLISRDFRFMIRYPENLYGRFGTSLFLSIIYGLIFLDAGDQNDEIDSNFQAHFGSIVFITLSVMFSSSLATALELPIQRPIFLREVSVDAYMPTSYFFAKVPIELTISFAQVLMESAIVIPLIQLRANFAVIMLIWWYVVHKSGFPCGKGSSLLAETYHTGFRLGSSRALNLASASFAIIIAVFVDSAGAIIEGEDRVGVDRCFVQQPNGDVLQPWTRSSSRSCYGQASSFVSRTFQFGFVGPSGFAL